MYQFRRADAGRTSDGCYSVFVMLGELQLCCQEISSIRSVFCLQMDAHPLCASSHTTAMLNELVGRDLLTLTKGT